MAFALCIGIMVIDMMGNGKMDYMKEEEFFIIIMVIDMKVNLNTIKKKEKELCIILMEIEIWVII